MNKDEKIRAEVERRYNYHKDHADDYAGTEHFWKADEDRELLSFIDSMQEEPKFFDEAIQECDDVRYNEDLGCRVNLSQLKRVAKKEATGKLKECIDNITDESLAKARKQLQEELVSEDLEQTIDTYLATYFGGEKEKQDWPYLKKMAIHFAEWQKEQLMKDSVLCGVDGWFINNKRNCRKNGRFYKYYESTITHDKPLPMENGKDYRLITIKEG